MEYPAHASKGCRSSISGVKSQLEERTQDAPESNEPVQAHDQNVTRTREIEEANAQEEYELKRYFRNVHFFPFEPSSSIPEDPMVLDSAYDSRPPPSPESISESGSDFEAPNFTSGSEYLNNNFDFS
jgi:hypothetical protein